MKRITNRVGEKHTTNQGEEITIVEYTNYKNCTIMFDNGYTVSNIIYGCILKGNIKNLFYPSVFGVGFLGKGKFNSAKYKKFITCGEVS